MQRSRWPILIGGALLLYALYASQTQPSTPAAPAQPAPKVQPKKPDRPAPSNRPCPNCPYRVAEQAPRGEGHAPQLGGTTSPDGLCHAIQLPSPLDWPKNIPSRGLGCCGFRSLDYCARIQGVPELVDWPEQLVRAGIPGGAYPQKIDQLINKFAPDAAYWNDTTKSHALLAAAIKSQRGACVDYAGRDPHYHGSIAHCVTVVAFDTAADWIGILDNNYPALDQIVWMGLAEFDQRWHGWCYGLLASTPGHMLEGMYELPQTPCFPVENGVVQYGLSRQGPFGDSSILNGSPSTTAAIIEAIGPEMAPIRVDVDHKIEPLKLDMSPLNLALGGGAVLLFYLLTESKKEN